MASGKAFFFEDNIKERLVNFSTTTMLFADRKVDQTIISSNRVVLLHGPPGTGKTTLCKALAQKLSIRLSDRYQHAQLIEINSHSLFSKWFSESGKLIMKLFERIQDLVDDNDSLVCVLIDEVESLTSARRAAISGSEPSDAIRAVNALLTQLDQLKKYSNCIVLTTSNLTQAIDLAFVDRADIKQYIGLPNLCARYEILRSCLTELMRVGIVLADKSILLPFEMLQRRLKDGEEVDLQEDALAPLSVSHSLLLIAQQAENSSGRFLRKVPFQAHAFFVQSTTAPVNQFLRALSQAVQKETRDREHMNQEHT